MPLSLDCRIVEFAKLLSFYNAAAADRYNAGDFIPRDRVSHRGRCADATLITWLWRILSALAKFDSKASPENVSLTSNYGNVRTDVALSVWIP